MLLVSNRTDWCKSFVETTYCKLQHVKVVVGVNQCLSFLRYMDTVKHHGTNWRFLIDVFGWASFSILSLDFLGGGAFAEAVYKHFLSSVSYDSYFLLAVPVCTFHWAGFLLTIEDVCMKYGVWGRIQYIKDVHRHIMFLHIGTDQPFLCTHRCLSRALW